MVSSRELIPCGDQNGVEPGAPYGAAFRRLLDALGTRRFFPEFSGTVSQMCQADDVHVFTIENGTPAILSSFSIDGSGRAEAVAHHYFGARMWRFDEGMKAGSMVRDRGPALLRLDTRKADTMELREFYSREKLSERLMLCGGEKFGRIALSLVRTTTRGLFEPDIASKLSMVSDVFFPMLVKHVDLRSQSRLALEALTSLQIIEAVLALAPSPMPPRERQVCARFLYGLSATSIAADLKISPETVLSFRKRIYQRLNVACHRELLLWYLAMHSDLADEAAIAHGRVLREDGRAIPQ